MCQIWTILPIAPDVQVSQSSVVTWRHFSELQTFSQTAAAQVHPQCHSNICDCCSLRWIQRQWFSALSQAYAYSCGWHCESNIFGPQCWSSLPRYGYIYIWMHDRLATWLHGYTETRKHRCTDTRITRMHGCTDTWMHGCMDAWIYVWCMMYDVRCMYDVGCKADPAFPVYIYIYNLQHVFGRMHGYMDDERCMMWHVLSLVQMAFFNCRQSVQKHTAQESTEDVKKVKKKSYWDFWIQWFVS